ncbi:DUF1566 domain-containing protein [Shewanella xiamenensis]|uniref:Lcl C-terminal domain-containing protein n=1 Tax=Shewanella xiamenensis TaxID=332186 RepID=UPI0035B9F700
MSSQRTFTVLFFISLCGFLCLSKPAQASDYASCLAEKLQGITHDAAVKAITEACQAQYASNTASKPASAPAKALIDGRYRDNGNGTITDTQTNLIWMRCSLGQQWTGSTCAGLSMEMSWNEALKTAQSFSYAGHSDWRVPTVDELDTLVQCSAGRAPLARPNGEYSGHTDGSCLGNNYQRPTINTSAFPNMPESSDSSYWSSSPYASDSSIAWFVHFGVGGVGRNYKNGFELSYINVRLVRVGQ